MARPETKKTTAVTAPRKETVVTAPSAVRSAPTPFVPAPPPIEPAVRFGAWTQVYGDYEKRNATGPADVSCCGPLVPAVPVSLSVRSRSGTVGFQAGADFTSRGLLSGNDGLIAGVLVGYLSSNLTLNTASYSTDLSLVGNEFAHLNARLSGPTTGLYATYFNGGFSTDFLFKVDILSLNETFNDSLAFCTCLAQNAFVPFAGAGSTSLINSTLAGNLNYRFDLYPNLWVEPTVGAQYTNSAYGGGAAALGLDDGSLVMVQGGARLGIGAVIGNRVLMTTTLTGLAYSDVLVSGGFIPGAAFAASNLLAQADQGQVRGRGVLAFNFDFGQGFSSFIQGQVRGGQGLIGAGGKAGVRIQW